VLNFGYKYQSTVVREFDGELFECREARNHNRLLVAVSGLNFNGKRFAAER
jgi:hypothetical protein